MPAAKFMRPAIAALGLTAMLATGALAQTAPAPAPEVRLSTIIARFEDRGDRIHEIETENLIYEIEYMTRDGARMKAGVDVLTGETVFERPDR